MKGIYNLKYSDKDGNIVFGRRLKHVRRIELENGKSHGHTFMSDNYDYLGRNGSSTHKRHPVQYERNVNGFKVVKKKEGL